MNCFGGFLYRAYAADIWHKDEKLRQEDSWGVN